MKISFPPLSKSTQTGYLLVLLVLIRGFFNAVIPLMDKTEARYGEIARLMSETGEWIVPQIDYGIPFWAKPPLSTWLSALSISAFGTQEFFVRLPYFLIGLLLVLLLGRYRSHKKMSFYLPGVILFSLPEFYLHAGVVSTDTLLCFSVALVMLSFWEGIQKKSALLWRYLLFAAMGLGLLAKGPIVGILTVPPILLWCALSDFRWKQLLNFPLFFGALISLGIALPWYLWAESRSPGFLDYFIVGEHFKRYFDSNWSGDKYGFPKQQPLGMVWLFLIGATLPWFGSFVGKLKKHWRSIRKDPWALYLILWFLWTPIFFSSSKSLIHPYTLPVMIPFALLIVYYWEGLALKSSDVTRAIFIPIGLFILYCSGAVNKVLQDNSDKYLIEQTLKSEYSLFSLEEKSYSSQFYSNGSIEVIDQVALREKIMEENPFYLLSTPQRFEKLSVRIKQEMTPVCQNKKRGLYRFIPLPE